jgi:hypothetical protein
VRAAALVVLSFWLALCPLGAQESRAESRPDPAEDLLARIDLRVYGAERAGMKSVEFSYRPGSTGSLDIASFRVKVAWRRGERETIEYLSSDGTRLRELPEMLRQPPPENGAPSVRESFELGARNLLSTFRGTSYTEQFRNWRKRIEARTVNGREERTIVCEPIAAGYFSRVEIALDRRDMPWRVVSVLARPEPGLDRIIDEPSWTEFDGKLVVTGFKKWRGSLSEQIVVNYQRRDGYIVPASYERLVPGKPAARYVFEDVKIG